ncbi:MAG: ribonuclease D, partial [Actinophytocola sp.]
RWADRDPAAAARLSAVRTRLAAIAEERRLPIENLLQPDLVRRTCWRPPEPLSTDTVADALRIGGAREWQISLTSDALSTALNGSG